MQVCEGVVGSKGRKEPVKNVLIPGDCCGQLGLIFLGDPLRNGVE